MTIKEFGETIEFNLRYNLKHTILGLGAPGIGKSEIISQIGKKYGYKVIDIRLAQMSEVEISGLIYPNRERTKTIWLSPEVLPDEKRDGPRTILLLDEITSCTKRVQVAAYQLILDRRIGQYVLPEGTMVIALGNREDDDGVYIRLAGPLADRFEIHYIEPDFQTWKNDYAIPHNIHKFVMDYLTVKPEALHTQIPGDSNIVFATPRSWTRVSDILKAAELENAKVDVQAVSLGDSATTTIPFDQFVERFIVPVDSKDRGAYTVGTNQEYGAVTINCGCYVLGENILLYVPESYTNEAGLPLADVLAKVGITECTAVNVICADGYSETIEAADLEGVCIFHNDGRIDTNSVAYPDYTLQDAVKIEVVK